MISFPSKPVRRGLAEGGPFNGQALSTDYPKGIIVIDRPRNVAWVYDWSEDSKKFVARSDEPSTLVWDQSQQSNVRRAMEENNYEVRSHPRAGEDY